MCHSFVSLHSTNAFPTQLACIPLLFMPLMRALLLSMQIHSVVGLTATKTPLQSAIYPLGGEHMIATVRHLWCDDAAHALLAIALITPRLPSSHHFPCPDTSTCTLIATDNSDNRTVYPKINLHQQ
jgi:hypothetical protein